MVPLWPTVMSGGAQATLERVVGNDQLMLLVGVVGDLTLLVPEGFWPAYALPALNEKKRMRNKEYEDNNNS